jgi:tetratricopeptide (TPR) repeat protein
MNIDYCAYHYKSPATWLCRKCHMYYGDCCISRSAALVDQPHCVQCDAELQSQGAANMLEPFWNVIHKFLAYPFKPGPLTFIVILSVLSAFIAGDLAGFAIGLFIVVACARYGYAVIEQASVGKTTPPSLNILLSFDPDSLFIKQIAVLLVGSVVIALGFSSGNVFLSLLILLFVTLILPASVLVLAVNKRLIAAVNPVLLTQLIVKLGAGYWVLYAYLFILSGGPYFILMHFSEYIPSIAYVPISTGVTMYFALVSAYMMGYTLLQYQKELGYRAELELEPGELENEPARKDARHMNLLLIEGRYDEALELFKWQVNQNQQDLQLKLRLHKMLAEMGKQEETVRYGQTVIEKAIESNAPGRAAEVFLTTLKVAPDFQIQSADALFKLAEYFHERGQPRNALSLLAQIDKRFPEYGNIGRVYLRIARIYADDLQTPDKAKPLLTRILDTPHYDAALKEDAAKLAKAIQ